MPFINGQIAADGPVIDIYVGISGPKATALQNAGQVPPLPVPVRALIDTGASGSVLDKQVVQALGLTPTGSILIHTPSTGSTPHQCAQYDVSIWFVQPHMQPQYHLMSWTIPVVEADLSAQTIGALIGRDLLAQCTLHYNGVTGAITLAY